MPRDHTHDHAHARDRADGRAHGRDDGRRVGGGRGVGSVWDGRCHHERGGGLGGIDPGGGQAAVSGAWSSIIRR